MVEGSASSGFEYSQIIEDIVLVVVVGHFVGLDEKQDWNWQAKLESYLDGRGS